MENRKFIKILIPILVLGFFVSTNRVFAYGIETHAFLTSQAIKFYNQNFTAKIPQELKDYLIDGSRREDNAPRYLNHFYDPVNNRGLDLGIYEGHKSKEWAQNEEWQNGLVYKITPSTVASILSASQIEQIKPIFNKTDFAWQKAIDLYAQGEKEQAFFTLGHVIHLLEDASVPDHTRNDPHPPYEDGGSPYENWTQKFSLNNPDSGLASRLLNKQPVLLSDLNSFFDGLATYSNNNFYSRDSIKNYELPESDYFTVGTDGENYGVKKDGEFGDYYLIVGGDSLNWSDHSKLIYKGETIVQNYWNRLSTKSVQYAVGVIDLFLKEAEKARENYLREKSQRPYLSTLLDGFKAIFGGGSQDNTLVAEIDLERQGGGANQINQADRTNEAEDFLQDTGPEEILPAADTELLEEINQPAEESPAIELIESSATAATKPQKNCTFNTNQSPLHQKLIINEVAWAGTLNSANDEWIELKNISGSELDISNWQLLDKEEQIKIIIPANTKLNAGGLYLLERTNNDSVPNVSAGQIYTGALSNTEEGLRLFDSQCNLLDEVFAGSSWPAGDNGARRTMERSSDLNWHTYSGNGENNIFGTPKKENSPVVYQSGGGGGSGGAVPTNAETNNVVNEPPAPLKILISEVQITGGTGKANNDFIELYNPNSAPINLNGYRLVKRTKTGTSDASIKSWTSDVTIPAKGYYLWTNSDFVDITATPDVTTTATLANDNGIAIRFGAEDTGIVIDSVGWGEAQNIFVEGSVFGVNPGANQSIQRKFQNNAFMDTDDNAADFETQTCSSPKAQSRTCQLIQVNQPPAAFFVYTPLNPNPGDLIIFDAASSTDPDGGIAFYQWDFGDGQIASTTQAAITHSYLSTGNYPVQLVVFDNQNASSTVASIIPINYKYPETNHLVISEILFDAAGSDDGKEFIELYNPTDHEQDIVGWSLRYQEENSTTTASLAVFGSKAQDKTKIPVKGFLLVGLSNYYAANYGNKSADINRSASLPNEKTISVVLYDGAAGELDRLTYSSNSINSAGQSLERKAWQMGNCLSSQNSGEFFGNSCDRDGNAGDFETRTIPNPQNSQSLPEPRSAPATVQNFNASYNPNKAEIKFNWNLSTDINGATSTIRYRISDINNASSTIILAEVAAATSTAKTIKEIGRNYKFEILAIDKDGLASAPTEQIIINAPSYLNSIYFYQDPRATTSPKYLLDLNWDRYPFIPIKYAAPYITPTDSQHMVIFYYNQEPLLIESLSDSNQVYGGWGWNVPGGLKLNYLNCYGPGYSSSYSKGANLILPDTVQQCYGPFGGVSKGAIHWSLLEDNHLSLDLSPNNFASSTPVANENYVTVAFYARYQESNPSGNPTQQLVAIDKTKYYFQNSAPVHQPPTAPSNVNFEFNEIFNLLKITWDKSFDSDTLDNLISYEVAYNNSVIITNSDFLEIMAEPGQSYNFELRAKDDFGNYSDITTANYEVAATPLPFGLSDIRWGYLDGDAAVTLSLNFERYPFMATTSPGAMIFFLNQEPPRNYSFSDGDYRNGHKIGGLNSVLTLSYQPCDFNGTWKNKVKAGGIFFNNANCPAYSDTLMSVLLLANIQEGDTQFVAEVGDARINGEDVHKEFGAEDYITVGFYQMGKRNIEGIAKFINVANYAKKIYFQP